MQTAITPLTSTLLLRAKEALVRGVIWAFIGILYGMLFVFFAELGKEWNLPMHPYFFSGVLAGTIGALIYSSMRLAVLLAIIISPVCLLYFIFSSGPFLPSELLKIVIPAGTLIGALYGLLSKSSRVYRADAKMFTGFSAGFLAALVYLILSELIRDVPLGIIVAVMCAVTGWLYVLFVPTFIRFLDNLLPPIGDGALAGASVAIFLAVSFFIMITSISTGPEAQQLPLIQQIHERLPQAVTGGMLGGALGGFLSGLFLTKWQDL